MKLLFFLPLLSTKGGQERTVTDKANWLAERGHEVLLVTYENDGPPAYELDVRVRCADLGCPYFEIYKQSFFSRLGASLKIKKYFRRSMSQVVGSFSPDVIVVTVPLTEFFLPELMRIAGRVPVVVESHLAYGYSPLARGATGRILDMLFPPMRAIRRSGLLIALTEGDASRWRKKHNNVCVIPNPLTCYPALPRFFSEAERQSPSSDSCRIICVGRLSPQKRFDRMVDAFALIAERYPRWRVDIFGDGGKDGKRLLQQRIESKGLAGRIDIHQPVDDIYAEYRRSDFFVLSSDFEGFGLVIIEAMACGIPVVSTDCPFGPSEIIADGETGLLAKMEVQDLADKMEWMITHEEERTEMGRKAREAAARYRKEVVMPEWEKAYAKGGRVKIED